MSAGMKYLFLSCEHYNAKDDQVQETEKDDEPDKPDEFSLEWLPFGGVALLRIRLGRAFGGHKAHRDAQAY
jgi:hypothetical protein